MSGSQIWAAIDNLYAVALATLPTTVDVIDGPVNYQVAEKDFLLIGCDDPHNTGQPVVAVDGTSDWAALGALKRDEIFTIWCTYVAWSGDPTLTTCRARAKTNIALIEAVLRNPLTTAFTLNGALGAPGWVALQIVRVAQVNAGDGVQVHVHFGVVCRGRI